MRVADYRDIYTTTEDSMTNPDMPDFTPTSLNLTKAAAIVLEATSGAGTAWPSTPERTRSVALRMWEALTGLQGQDAITYALQVYRNPGVDIHAAVAPF